MPDAHGQTLLSVHDATVNFGGIIALESVCLTVCEGEMVGLIGPNGSGKTTLLNMLSGIYRPSRGHLSWRGRRLAELRPWHAFELGIARTFQGIELVPSLTALENVLLSRHRWGSSNWLTTCLWIGWAAREERRAIEAGLAVLARMGVTQYAHVKAGSLPLGVQKVVAIGRALAAEPSLLLLDEPTAGLSWPDKERLMDIVSSMRRELNLTVIWVEHDLQLIKNCCERVIVLHEGRKLADGRATEVLSDPRVLAIYSGFARV